MKQPLKVFVITISFLGEMTQTIAFSFVSTSNVLGLAHQQQNPLLVHPLPTNILCRERKQQRNPNVVSSASLQLAKQNDIGDTFSRRSYVKKSLLVGVGFTPISSISVPSNAAGSSDEALIQKFAKDKSRNDEGYSFRKHPSEWKESLSILQYSVLRRGGTERQRSSILEKETRSGIYECAGCHQNLFSSAGKFESGTGWPSFESPIDFNAIEIEDVGWLQSMDGAEVRCRTCGGHLGDVFGDGWRYGSKTGKRFCINGAALIFRPANGDKHLRGDIPPRNKIIQYEPSLRRDT